MQTNGLESFGSPPLPEERGELVLGFEDDGWKVGEDGARGGVPIGEGGHQEGEG